MNSNRSGKAHAGRRQKQVRSVGAACIWPSGVQARYGISACTRWRWEKAGKLPPRDVFVGGLPIGWRPETIETAESGPVVAS